MTTLLTGSARSRTARVAVVCVAQLALLLAAVFGQVSARVTGTEYLVRVQPIDPIDPFRGAYVALGYPDLRLTEQPFDDSGETRDQTLFVPLQRSGEVWVGGTPVADEPDGPALRCANKGWRLSCGIESYFLPQDKALQVERAVAAGTALARLRVDSAGHAAIVEVVTDRAGLVPVE